MIVNFLKPNLKFIFAIFLLIILHEGTFAFFITFVLFAFIFHICKMQAKTPTLKNIAFPGRIR